MNIFHARGNLTRDIEIRYSNTGMAIAKTALATTRKWTANGEKKEETMFIDIVFFGRSAEIANQYLNKGSNILVTGRITFSQWVDNNSIKRNKHELVVESMEMIDTRTKAPKDLDKPQNEMPSRNGVQQAKPKDQLPEMDDEGQEIPF